MANCQNNMRYGRQMNQNNNFRTAPNHNSGFRNMPANDCGCRNTPAGSDNSAARGPERQRRSQEPCGCGSPETREGMSPERQRRMAEMRTPECAAKNHHTSEGCENRDPLRSLPIAMAYVPWQRWQNLFESCKGFEKGTIFEDLHKPFHGRGGCNR